MVIRTGQAVVALEPAAALRHRHARRLRDHGRRAGAAGDRRARDARAARLISGDRPLGVLTTGTLQSMIYGRPGAFRRPVVVGTELVSLSALLTCRRAGIRPVAMIEANDRPTAPRGAGAVPAAARHRRPLRRRAGRDPWPAAGRSGDPARIADGRLLELACDGVLLTGRFVPEAALVRMQPPRRSIRAAAGRRSTSSAAARIRPISPPATCCGRSRPPAGRFARACRIGACIADDLAGRLPTPSTAAADRARARRQAGRAAAALACPWGAAASVSCSFVSTARCGASSS